MSASEIQQRYESSSKQQLKLKAKMVNPNYQSSSGQTQQRQPSKPETKRTP